MSLHGVFTVHCTLNTEHGGAEHCPGTKDMVEVGSLFIASSRVVKPLVLWFSTIETRSQIPFGTEFVRAISSDISLTKLRSGKTLS